MLFDINKIKWSDSLCEQLGIPIKKLPDTRPPGTVIGAITDKAAKATGLPRGTPVIAGGGDQQCAALGLGVVRPGQVSATTGTGTFVLADLEEPKLDPKMRVLTSLSVIPDHWVLEASMFTSGALYRWFRDNFMQCEQQHAREQGIDIYELMNREVECAEPGARGLLMLPHFAGAGAPYWDPEAKGVLHGLTLAHTRSDILRALAEGVCFEVKKSLDVLGELGLDIHELRIAGGVTRSDVWNRLQADIYGKPVVKTGLEETTALGAAILGCVGCDIYRTPQDAVKNMLEIKSEYKPDGKLEKFYKGVYVKHKKLYDDLIVDD
jgi:sugar (pentulose or hexulose) kinase